MQTRSEALTEEAIEHEWHESKPMLIRLTTEKTVSEAAAALHAAVQANHFGVMQVRNLKETVTQNTVARKVEDTIVKTMREAAGEKASLES